MQPASYGPTPTPLPITDEERDLFRWNSPVGSRRFGGGAWSWQDLVGPGQPTYSSLAEIEEEQNYDRRAARRPTEEQEREEFFRTSAANPDFFRSQGLGEGVKGLLPLRLLSAEEQRRDWRYVLQRRSQITASSYRAHERFKAQPKFPPKYDQQEFAEEFRGMGGQSAIYEFENNGGNLEQIPEMHLSPDDANSLALARMSLPRREEVLAAAGLTSNTIKGINAVLAPTLAEIRYGERKGWAGGFADRPTGYGVDGVTKSLMKMLQIFAEIVDLPGTVAYHTAYESTEGLPGPARMAISTAAGAVFGLPSAGPIKAFKAISYLRSAPRAVKRIPLKGEVYKQQIRSFTAREGSKNLRTENAKLKSAIKQANMDEVQRANASRAQQKYEAAVDTYVTDAAKPVDVSGTVSAIERQSAILNQQMQRIRDAYIDLVRVVSPEAATTIREAVHRHLARTGVIIVSGGAHGDDAESALKRLAGHELASRVKGAPPSPLAEALPRPAGSKGTLQLSGDFPVSAQTPSPLQVGGDVAGDIAEARRFAKESEDFRLLARQIEDERASAFSRTLGDFEGTPHASQFPGEPTWGGYGPPTGREFLKDMPTLDEAISSGGRLMKVQEALTDVHVGMRQAVTRMRKLGLIGKSGIINRLVTAPGQINAGIADFRLFSSKLKKRLKGSSVTVANVDRLVALLHYEEILSMHPGRALPGGLEKQTGALPQATWEKLALEASLSPEDWVVLKGAAADVAEEYVRMLDSSVRAGIVDPKLAAELTRIYPYYNPIAYTARLSEDVIDALSPVGPVKVGPDGIGSNGLHYLSEAGLHISAVSPIQMMLERMVRNRIMTHRNQLVREMVDTFKDDPKFGHFFKDVTPAKKLADPNATELKSKLPERQPGDQLDPLMSRKQRSKLVKAGMKEEADRFAQPLSSKKKNVVFMRNGVRQEWQVPEWFTREISYLVETFSDSSKPANMIQRWIQNVQAPLRGAYITYNPAFPYKNLIFDAFTALVTRGLLPYEIVKALTMSFQKFDTSIAKQLFDLSGADQAKFYGHSQRSKDLMREVGLSGGKDLSDKALNVWRLVRDAIPAFGQATEKSTRLAQFMKTLDKLMPNWREITRRDGAQVVSEGWQFQQAAAEAVEVTLNFRRGGYIVNVLNDPILFLRAAMNGMMQPLRAMDIFGAKLVGQEAGKSRMIMAGAMMAKLSLDAYNVRQPMYYDIREDIRYNSAILMLPGIKRDKHGRQIANYVVLLPFLREWAPFLGSSAWIMERFHAEDPVSFMGFMNKIIPGLSPVPIFPAPEIAQLGAEQLFNKDLYKFRKIVPEDLKGRPAGEQKLPWTPRIYTLAGKLGVSPVRAQHLAEGIGGTPARMVAATMDKFVSQFLLEDVPAHVQAYVNRYIKIGEEAAPGEARNDQALFMRKLKNDSPSDAEAVYEALNTLDPNLLAFTGILGQTSSGAEYHRRQEASISGTPGEVRLATDKRKQFEQDRWDAEKNAADEFRPDLFTNLDAPDNFRRSIDRSRTTQVTKAATVNEILGVNENPEVKESITEWLASASSIDDPDRSIDDLIDNLPDFRSMNLFGKLELASMALFEYRKSYELATNSVDEVDFDLQDLILNKYREGWEEDEKNYVKEWVESGSYGDPLAEELAAHRRTRAGLDWFRFYKTVLDPNSEYYANIPLISKGFQLYEAALNAERLGRLDGWLVEEDPKGELNLSANLDLIDDEVSKKKILYRRAHPEFDIATVKFYGSPPATLEAQVEIVSAAGPSAIHQFYALVDGASSSLSPLFTEDGVRVPEDDRVASPQWGRTRLSKNYRLALAQANFTMKSLAKSSAAEILKKFSENPLITEKPAEWRIAIWIWQAQKIVRERVREELRSIAGEEHYAEPTAPPTPLAHIGSPPRRQAGTGSPPRGPRQSPWDRITPGQEQR